MKDTSHSKSGSAVFVVAVMLLILLLPTGYVGGYFWLGKVAYTDDESLVRIFRSAAQRDAYLPVMKIEGFLRAKEVYSITPRLKGRKSQMLSTYE